jgi:hypothetical protein
MRSYGKPLCFFAVSPLLLARTTGQIHGPFTFL